MVEFVLVIPLVLLLIIGTAQVGRGFNTYNALTKTLRDGSRYAAEVARTAGGSTGNLSISAATRAQIQNLVVFGNTAGTGQPVLPGLTVGNVTVTTTATGDVDLNVNYNYLPIFTTSPTFGFGTPINPAFTMRANITMRAL